MPDGQAQLAKTRQTIQEKVVPAYRTLQEYLEQSLEGTSQNNGVWALPDGDAYYAYLLRENTTTDLTAEKIHRLGLQEVERIQAEMRVLLAKEWKDDPERGVGDLLREFARDERFYYPNTAEGRKECLDRFASILARAREQFEPLFDLKPKLPVSIIPVPKHEEKGSAIAYYRFPSFDGSRPGAFYINLRDLRQIPKFGMETLAIHEAEPGHHFQIALQVESDLPISRKIGRYNAYGEGWALYVEKLGLEENFYSSPMDELGHLQDELLRAARLVIDTGIHAKRWSREEAIDYMMTTTGMHLGEVTAEVERYFVMPGQACSYKIGQLKILELRKKAKDCLGDRFDLRAFHNEVLKLGNVPLTVLEEVVNTYIQNNVSSAQSLEGVCTI